MSAKFHQMIYFVVLLTAVIMVSNTFVAGLVIDEQEFLKDFKDDHNYSTVHGTDNTNDDDVVSKVISYVPFVNDIEFLRGFIESITVTVVSELGDKTFFIAAIMAMRYSKFVVFCGSISALGLMTAISVGFGMAATIIPRIYTFYISTALLALSGLKMLYDACSMSPTDALKEFEEVQSDLNRRAANNNRKKSKATSPTNNEYVKVKQAEAIATAMPDEDYDSSKVLMQAFSMTLLAEWGDRSQLTTIVLSAKEDALGVISGGIVGHALCTGLAIICGSMIAQKISVRTVTFFGGVLFLIFAFVALVYDPEGDDSVVTSR